MKQLIALILVLVLAACGGSSEGAKTAQPLKIACAANMQYAMDSIAVIFTQKYGIQCDITSGSSGMLTAQIDNKAPYDIFVSANMDYPQAIYEKQNGDAPQVYAKGRLVLVVNKTKAFGSINEVLMSDEVQRIGLAEVETAPYGMAAQEFLKTQGYFQQLNDKWVVGESIGQVNQYITTGAVDAAFTSYSFKVKNELAFNYFEVDQQLFTPIQQGIILLEHGKNTNADASKKFVTFLTESPTCKAVLNYFGYLTN